MKYKKQAGGLKFEIWNWGGLKNILNWSRTVENS